MAHSAHTVAVVLSASVVACALGAACGGGSSNPQEGGGDSGGDVSMTGNDGGAGSTSGDSAAATDSPPPGEADANTDSGDAAPGEAGAPADAGAGFFCWSGDASSGGALADAGSGACPAGAGTVSGTATLVGSAGGGVPGIAVVLQGSGCSLQTVTGAGGTYAFTGVANGAYSLVFDETVASIDYSATLSVTVSASGATFGDAGAALGTAGTIAIPAASQVFTGESFLRIPASTDGGWISAIESPGVGAQILDVAKIGGAAGQVGVGVPQDSVVVSPDGRWYAFASNSDGLTPGHLDTGALELAPTAGGSPMQLAANVQTAPNVPAAQFTADGSGIAYVSGEDGTLEIYGAATCSSTPVASASNVAAFALAPVGTGLAYVSGVPGTDAGWPPSTGFGTLTVQKSPSSAPITLSTDALGIIYTIPAQLEFAPDGDHLFYLTEGSGSAPYNYVVGSISQGTSATVGTGNLPLYGPFGFQNPQFTPDGSKVFFISGQALGNVSGTLSVADTATGMVTTVDTNVLSVTLSTNGAVIAYFKYQPAGDGSPNQVTDLYAAPVAGGAAVFIGTTSPTNNATPQISPDGSKVAFASGDLCPALLVSPTTTSNPLVLSPVSGGQLFGFSPDGRNVVFGTTGPSCNDPNMVLQVVAATGGTPTPLNEWVQRIVFAGPSLVTIRSGTPSPFDTLDGVWVTSLP